MILLGTFRFFRGYYIVGASYRCAWAIQLSLLS